MKTKTLFILIVVVFVTVVCICLYNPAKLELHRRGYMQGVAEIRRALDEKSFKSIQVYLGRLRKFQLCFTVTLRIMNSWPNCNP